MKTRQDPQIREFLLRAISENPQGVGSAAVKEFGLSRTAISKYLHRLVEEGLIVAEGKTRARTYALREMVERREIIALVPGLAEDRVWREKIAPHLHAVPAAIEAICQYGFTEMFNNVLDHSEGTRAEIVYRRNHARIAMTVIDDGVGIFEKIKRDFGLADPQTALLELSKGKLTSDRARHSGEGIFFTSRMFDPFTIISGALTYRKNRSDDGWLVETEKSDPPQKGTAVHMVIPTDAAWTAKDIFAQYQDDAYRFSKTNVPIKLAQYAGEGLVSRSQAKRILARFDKFSEVTLDFSGIEEIGQSFADEIFRVYRNAHPEVRLTPVGVSPSVAQMIAHVTGTER